MAFCRKAGYRPELAWSLCDYADTLLQRSDEGDRSKAMSMLDESLAISRDLGMRPLPGAGAVAEDEPPRYRRLGAPGLHRRRGFRGRG